MLWPEMVRWNLRDLITPRKKRFLLAKKMTNDAFFFLPNGTRSFPLPPRTIVRGVTYVTCLLLVSVLLLLNCTRAIDWVTTLRWAWVLKSCFLCIILSLVHA